MAREGTKQTIPPVQWGPDDATTTVVAFHGRGHSPDDIVALSERMGPARVRWIAPHADGSQWYALRFMDAAIHDDAQARRAVDDAVALIGAVRAQRPHGRVVALGFSQGACLVAECVLSRAPHIDAAAVLTGGYFGREARSFACDLRGLPVLLTTSAQDEWVPLGRVRETETALTDAGACVQLLVSEGGRHEVDDAALAALERLIHDE